MKSFGILLIFILGAICSNAQRPINESMAGKATKLKKRADARYNRLHFLKAVEGYKELLKLQKVPEVELRLASCYQELNQPHEAVFWYEQALKDGADLQKEDYLNYALMLSANEQYTAAKKIFASYETTDPWVTDHIQSLDSFSTFYQDQYAYEVSWEAFNSSEKDFSPTFVNDQLVFVSARSTDRTSRTFHWDGSKFLDLFTKSPEGRITKLEGGINSKYHEGPATFWDKGTKVLFTRNSYDGTKVKLSTEGVNNLRMFYAEVKPSGQWLVKEEFPFNSDEYSIGHPSITPDGKTLYFASDMPGGYGGVDLYKSVYKYDQWETPVNLGPVINTPRDELFPCVRKNDVLYFASDGHEGMGGLDLFRTILKTNPEVQNLGYPINTSADDFGIAFRPQSNHAYFSSNRSGGMGDDDIYSVIMSDYAVEVVLIDEQTGEPITSSGRIDLLRTLRSQMNSPGISIAATRIEFGVERGTSFLATGSADGYYQGNLIIQLEDKLLDKVKHLYYEIPLKRTHIEQQAEILIVVNNDRHTQHFFKVEDATTPYEGSLSELRAYLKKEAFTVVKETYLTNIYYDFDQFTIRSDAAQNLNELAAHLASDGALNIILESHTDARGSNQYNQLLAKRRVEAAREYLIKSGIDPDRIYTGSHGEEQTFVDCIECSEEEHQSNRRTEIRIEINKVDLDSRLTSLNR